MNTPLLMALLAALALSGSPARAEVSVPVPAIGAATAVAAPYDETTRDQLQRQIAIAELQLRLAEIQARTAEAQRKALTPAPAQALAAALAVAPVAPVAPAIAVAVPPPAAVVAAQPAQQQGAPARHTARTERNRREATGSVRVGYIAQAGKLMELHRVGKDRLRAVEVDTRQPLIRPGVGMIAEPVGGDVVAAADGRVDLTRGSRVMRSAAGAGVDLRGLGLPPLPGLASPGGQP